MSMLVLQGDVRDPAKLAKKSNKGVDVSNGWGETPRGTNNVSTLGWEPACNCNAPTVPPIIFDPFSGAGTTLLVSGRHGIGLDLKHEYCVMTRGRADNETPLFANVSPRVTNIQSHLFATVQEE